MMGVLLIIGGVIALGISFLLAHLSIAIVREDSRALKLFQSGAQNRSVVVALEQPFCAALKVVCAEDAWLTAPFSTLPALYYETKIDEYISRSPKTLLDEAKCASFYWALGEWRVELPENNVHLNWVASEINAYQGLAGRMTSEQKQRLESLGADVKGATYNPLKALSVEEKVMLPATELWVLGRVTNDEINKSDGALSDSAEKSKLRLDKPWTYQDPIIAPSAQSMQEQLRYMRLRDFSAACFLSALPVLAIILFFL